MEAEVNQHEKRKNEIIDCAAALFFQGSYEKTSVQQIIDTLGIAKGTFYYYFKSKTDLLNHFTVRESRKILAFLDSIAGKKELDAVQKFNLYFETAMNWKVSNWDLLIVYITHSGNSGNSLVYQSLLEHNIKTALPSLNIMIREGIEQGVFHTEFPELVGEAIFRTGAAITDQLRPYILESSSRKEGFEQFIRIMEFYSDLIEKMLGAEKDSLKIFDKKHLETIYQVSSENRKGGNHYDQD